MNYLRHTLGYLKKDTKPLASHSLEHRELLDYWLKQQYPLIVTRQPESTHREHIQLALPYYNPQQQKKIRASFLFSRSSIIKTQELPSLQELFPSVMLPTNMLISVYGSYCWQYLTQQAYVQASSDLDVLISYSGQSLRALSTLYHYLSDQLPISALDGEIRFPQLGDCSWQELIQTENSDSLLFKSEHQIKLVQRDHLYAKVPTLLK
jgi:phosphoribosyl-dephospho-CoA transferase